MGPRTRKLAAAGAVLLAGLLLAWPLRLNEPLAPVVPGTAPLSAASRVDALPVLSWPADANHRPAAEGVAAIGVSTGVSPLADSFAALPPSTADAPSGVTPTLSGWNEAASAPETAAPVARIHVVHEGDNLDRLARRYLGDAGRALEIFDLNRDVLENPHLLPIGVELKIPPAPKSPAL